MTDDLVYRMRRAVGVGAMIAALDEGAEEIERLRHDLDQYVARDTELVGEIEELRAAITEYLAAYDTASDPTATGSTCRLIRAEGALRDALGEKP